jgi:hypothetical protein
MWESLKRFVRGLFNWGRSLALVFAVLIAGELLPPWQALHRFLGDHPALLRGLSALTMGMAILGVLLLVGTQFVVRVGDEWGARSRPASLPGGTRGRASWFAGRFSGWAVSGGFHDEAPFWEVKRAFQRGVWWSEPRWRRFSLMGLGAILLTFGLFGFIFFISPPGVKLLMAGALVYAAARTAWGFYKAQPPPEA